jgi:hypothetical protein
MSRRRVFAISRVKFLRNVWQMRGFFAASAAAFDFGADFGQALFAEDDAGIRR